MLNTKVNEKEVWLTPDNPLYNPYRHMLNLPSTSSNVYAKEILRKLLMAEPLTEDSFRAIPRWAKIGCNHGNVDCECKRLEQIRSVVNAFPSYEEGIIAVGKLAYPDLHLNADEEGKTHINISRDAGSDLGKDLWDFLTEKYTVYDGGPYVSLSQLLGAKTFARNKGYLPALYVDGQLVRNEETFEKHVFRRLQVSDDISEALYQNTLPISIYTTKYIRGKKRVIVDIDDIWLSERLTSMSKLHCGA